MPNIYYCNGLANSDLGRLRAVLSWEECRNLLKLRSEEHTSELQSRLHLVCRLLLEKKNIPLRTDRLLTSFPVRLALMFLFLSCFRLHCPLLNAAACLCSVRSLWCLFPSNQLATLP